MLSTLNSKETDPHPTQVVEPEVVLAARIAREFSSLAPDAIKPSPERQPPRMGPSQPSAGGAAVPPVDATFRATDVNAGRRPKSKWLVRTLLAFMFALASAVAAGAWQYYGDTAQQLVASYLPRFSLTSLIPSSQPAATTPDAAQPAAPPAQAAVDQQTADAATAAPAPSATDTAAPAAATPAVDQTQLVQSMASDLASMREQIGELKVVIDQLKAGQDQMMARISDARPGEARVTEPRPRPAPQSALRAAAAALHKPPPRPASAPAQTVAPQPLPPAAVAAPMQLQPAASQDDGVVRPPMPVR